MSEYVLKHRPSLGFERHDLALAPQPNALQLNHFHLRAPVSERNKVDDILHTSTISAFVCSVAHHWNSQRARRSSGLSSPDNNTSVYEVKCRSKMFISQSRGKYCVFESNMFLSPFDSNLSFLILIPIFVLSHYTSKNSLLVLLSLS